MKIAKILLILLAFALVSCVSKKNPLAKAEWILGTWECKDDKENISYETWTKINKNEFLGKLYEIDDIDTFYYGYSSILQYEKSLVYIPEFWKRYRDLSMPFSLTSISEDEMIFENHESDYPYKVLYRKIGNDFLVLEIITFYDGEKFTFSSSMKKIK